MLSPYGEAPEIDNAEALRRRKADLWIAELTCGEAAGQHGNGSQLSAELRGHPGEPALEAEISGLYLVQISEGADRAKDEKGLAQG
jgi:hypothetical protein